MRRPRLFDHVTSGIDRIAPYQPGTSASQAAGAGQNPAGFARLASNENPRGCGPLALEAIRSFAQSEAGRYPDGDAGGLKRAIARHLGVGPDRILAGNGSNEVLEMAAWPFLRPGAACVYSRHAFVVYGLATLGRGARPVVVPDKDLSHDLEAMAQACKDPEVRVVYVANPNNPTGSWHPPEAVRAFLRKVPAEVLVVLDEAYHEYTSADPGESVAWACEFENLLVTRSFSKIHGLAALRVGYGVTNPDLAELLNRVRQPFNVNSIAQAAACAALADAQFVRSSRELNSAGLETVGAALDRLGIERAPTRANFVMARFADAKAAHARMLQDGLMTRPLGAYELADWLRITIGAPEENDRLIRSLERLAA